MRKTATGLPAWVLSIDKNQVCLYTSKGLTERQQVAGFLGVLAPPAGAQGFESRAPELLPPGTWGFLEPSSPSKVPVMSVTDRMWAAQPSQLILRRGEIQIYTPNRLCFPF